MWTPLIIYKSDQKKIDLDCLISGKVPAIILKQFYDKKTCKLLSRRILSNQAKTLQTGKLTHVGPFLMSYATKKNEYFLQAKIAKTRFDMMFDGFEFPMNKVFSLLKKVFPKSKIALAHESGKYFSPFVIRIHKPGERISIHKDNVRYEGKEYAVSKIVHQLSCVLHLQKSEEGGDLIIYQKIWNKTHERFRNLHFGYSSGFLVSENSCKISNIEEGDLVLINPIQYHEVKKIQGCLPRITLGMFLGFSRNKQEIISWA